MSDDTTSAMDDILEHAPVEDYRGDDWVTTDDADEPPSDDTPTTDDTTTDDTEPPAAPSRDG